VSETVEHPFGTMKGRMGATHFLTKTLPKAAADMALSVLGFPSTLPHGLWVCIKALPRSLGQMPHAPGA
jgi:hypothetical protein